MGRKIFISYRRDDDPGGASLVHQCLAKEFEGEVFFDLSMHAGQNIPKHLENEIAGCSVFVCVMGQRWNELLAGRIKDEQPDYVVQEVSAALRLGKFILPILLFGARPPQERELPNEIRGLHPINCFEISNKEFNSKLREIIPIIRKHLPPPGRGGRGGGGKSS